MAKSKMIASSARNRLAKIIPLLVAGLEFQAQAADQSARLPVPVAQPRSGGAGRHRRKAPASTAPAALPGPDLPGLGPDFAWKPVAEDSDAQGLIHTQWEGWFYGLRVDGMVTVTHRRGARSLPATLPAALPLGNGDVPRLPAVHGSLRPGLDLKDVEEVLARRLGPGASPLVIAASELILFPVTEPLILTLPGQGRPANAAQCPTHLAALALAYRVETREEAKEAWEYVVDAHTGSILADWPLDEHAGRPDKGMGRTLFAGDVDLDISELADGKGYVLVDQTRGAGGNRVVVADRQNPPQTLPVTSPDKVFGAMHATLPGSGTAQTAAADAAYSLQATWDFWHDVLGRNGYDGKDGAVTVVLNAFGDPDNAEYKEPGRIEFGPAKDGLLQVGLKTLGHEFTHGVTWHTANWRNANGTESAGLNEGTSDFFGEMIATWKEHGGGKPGSGLPRDRIGDTGATWVLSWTKAGGSVEVLRNLARPSAAYGLDQYDFQAMQHMDKYANAGPLERALCILSRGASAIPGEDTYSRLLPGGMVGIGNDAAARIWYGAMLDMAGGDTYLAARRAAIRTAERLYPADHGKGLAVRRAFGAVAVGDPEDVSDPSHSGLALRGVTVTPGAELVLGAEVPESKAALTADFHVDGISMGRVGAPPYTLKLPASVLLANGPHWAKVYLANQAGQVIESPAVSFTLDNPEQQLLGDPGLEARNPLAARWAMTPADLVSPREYPRPHGGDQCALFSAAGGAGDQVLAQQVAIPAGRRGARLQCWFWVGGAGAGGDTLALQVADPAAPDAPPTVLATLTPADRSEAWFQRTFDLDAFKGRTVQIRFVGRVGGGSEAKFAVDDITLQAAKPALPGFEDFWTPGLSSPSLSGDEIRALLKAGRFRAGGRTYQIGPNGYGHISAEGQPLESLGHNGRLHGQQTVGGPARAWQFLLFPGGPALGPDGSPLPGSEAGIGLIDFTVTELPAGSE